MLLIREPWESQPQEAAGVDWGNPLARRLVRLVTWNLGAPYDLVSQSFLTQVGANAAQTATRFGIATTNTVDDTYWTLPIKTEVHNSLSAGWVGSAASGTGIILRDATSTGGSIILWRNAGAFDMRCGGGDLTAAGTWTAGKIYNLVATSSASGGVCRIFVDGVLTVDGVGSFNSLASPWYIHRNGTAGAGGVSTSLLLAIWDAALSSADAKSFADNPWQLFQPRNIWVPVSAGGGGYTITASPGAYTLSGQSATITRSRALTASPGSYALSGQAATITRNRALVASSGAYTLSGQAATITRNRALTASPGAYTLSGQAATITYTPGSGTTYTLTASAGAYTLSGQVASLLYGRLLVAGSGSYAVTGQDATITYTPAALPTVGRPASDTSNSGWTASTGSDLYAMLDEVTPDAGDYIVTTSTGSICEMPLQTTAYPGTSAQKLSYRASSSTGNSVIVRLKNTGGATVRTETQVLTATDTLYEITLTSGEIAAITSGALSVELESA